jgi:hypothetical protein
LNSARIDLMPRHALLVLVLGLTSVAAGPAGLCADDPPPARLQVIRPPLPDFETAGLNTRGDLVGFHWVESTELPGVVEQRPVLVRGAEVTEIPRLDGYTATMPAGLSDEARVVGRCGKPAAPGTRVALRSQAFVWDRDHGIRGLGTLPGDVLSYATAIARDGRTILGASLLPSGQPRVCLWRLQTDDQWQAEELPLGAPVGSPFLSLSPDGRRVATVIGGDAILWTDPGDGAWTRQVIARDGQLAPRAVNDAGVVAGLRHAADGRTHAVLWSENRGPTVLEEPPGFVRAEARGLNASGMVVGFVDGPNASEIGPRAFAWDGKSVRLLDEGGPGFVMATAINDAGQVAGVVEPLEVPPADGKPAAPPVP